MQLYLISIKLILLAFKFHLHPVFPSQFMFSEWACQHIFIQMLNTPLSCHRRYLRCNCFAKQQEDVRHLWFTDWWQCLHNGKSALSAHTIIMWMMLDPCLCMCFSMITTESTFFLSSLPFSAQSLKHQGGESERRQRKERKKLLLCLKSFCAGSQLWFNACVRLVGAC